jgi:hypothetical protein
MDVLTDSNTTAWLPGSTPAIIWHMSCCTQGMLEAAEGNNSKLTSELAAAEAMLTQKTEALNVAQVSSASGAVTAESHVMSAPTCVAEGAGTWVAGISFI